MKIFSYNHPQITAVAVAFNRGHAAKMIAKELEQRGFELLKSHSITEIKVDEVKRGKVFVIREPIPYYGTGEKS